jgi:hypothetical protein
MSIRTLVQASCVCVVLAAALVAPAARANERRFTYTYESLVLNPGDVEVEPWTTFRIGRRDYYSRMDNRLEFELGVVDGVQTAWYFNWSSTTQDDAGARVQQSSFESVSNEWKLKLSDPVADVLGSAVYLEGAAGPSEAEVEGKLILDKRAGRFVVALNLVGEHEWAFEEDETQREVGLEIDLGLAWLVTDRFSLGLEARNVNEIKPEDGWEHSALFAGPAAAYASDKWWTAVTVLPQVLKLKGEEEDEGSKLVLSGRERLEARVLFGMHL